MRKLTVFILCVFFVLGTIHLSTGQIPTIAPFGPITAPVDFLDYIALRNQSELRVYDNGNYVGFEAPALSADQIWVLPTADGTSLQVLRTDGSGALSWASAAAGSGTFELDDDDASHILVGTWNETETTSNRIFNFIVNGGNRTLDLYENFKVLDGTDIELHGSGGEKVTLAIDTQNAERTLDMSANLTVTGASTINQDVSTTGDPTFDDTTVDKIEANECFTYDAVQTATGDGTTTVDWGLGNVMYFTFGGQNDTFTFTAPPGVAKLTLVLKQDGVGSRLPTWPGTVLWPGNVAPTLSTTAAYVDIVTFLWDGTSYFGLFNGDFR